MNTSKIKAYAVQARRDFIRAVSERANIYGIFSDDQIEPMEFKGDLAIIGERAFPKKVGELRERLVNRIKKDGFETVIRAAAYTWFNRLVAIRYMEIHDYLDHGYRVLSNNGGSIVPEILEHAADVEFKGLDKKKVIELKLAGTKDNELYRVLILAQCNVLHQFMPFLFEKIDSETKLLLPDNLIHSDSPTRKMVTEIDESDWKDVEIIGWIYQFYISERKDEIFKGLKRNKKITPKNIPAVTQLFTPHWIVRYLVENSLGRLWMLNHPDSRLVEKMDYYIKPEQVKIDFLKISSPEEIKICDPANGSGHMLVYAFDLLCEIYKEEGYRSSEIPEKVLTHNIFGIEIDSRAGQLAAFALTMKAREKDRRFFQMNVQPNICVLENIEFEEGELKSYMDEIGPDLFTIDLKSTLRQFEETDNFGSLIRPDLTDVSYTLRLLKEKNMAGNILLFETHPKVLKALKQADYLSPKYHVVITNPPYMGGKGMNGRLKAFAQDNYKDSKSDLFAMFIERNLDLAVKQGFVGMITMQSWMFLSSFEKLRSRLLNQDTILTMAHFGVRAFDSIGGEVVSTTAFVLENVNRPDHKGGYLRLVDSNSEAEKDSMLKKAIDSPGCGWFYLASATDFKKIPGSPIAYWASKGVLNAFEKYSPLEDVGLVRQGVSTSDNVRFLRLWYEVSNSRIGYEIDDLEQANSSEFKWFPYNKGGGYRKWYGNQDFIINYENDGYELKKFQSTLNQGWTVRLKSREYYFKPSVSWPKISSRLFSARYYPSGFIFDVAGCCYFPSKEASKKVVVSFLNSDVSKTFLQFLSPTLNFEIEHVKKLPYTENISGSNLDLNRIYFLSQSDWNSSEASWNFTKLTLLHPDYCQSTLKGTYQQLCTHWRDMTLEMQRLEEENNRIFIDAYGLQDELASDVPLSEITLTCNPHFRYGGNKDEAELQRLLLSDTIKELISYAIGCMMGRYSLDDSGLIYVHSGNEGFDSSKYATFPADDDGIIPIMDQEWFADDAANRFIEFMKVTWSSDTLDENLKFISDSLKQKSNESHIDTIRRYLSRSFFKDHLKTYKKRPIYWLFSSGKQKAFECLVYLHRYNESTLSRIRSSYVTPLQGNFSARLEFLQNEKEAAPTASAQRKIQKEIDVLKKKQAELSKFDDELRHYADMKISLDLDDGVKVNYGKFGNLLAEKKAITGKK